MREILFRAKRKDTGEWVEGNLLQVELDSGTDYYIIPLVTNGSLVKTTLLLKFISPCFEVEENTIGQFTSLHDKNGKRIFEGDIVKVHDAYKQYGEPNHEFTGVVEFDNASFLINQGDFCHHYRWMDYECEVVSTIHDEVKP